MTLKNSGFLKVTLIAAGLVVAALISLNIFLDRKIAREAPGLLEKVSKEAGFRAYVEHIGLGPFFNLKISGIKVIDPSPTGKEIADIKKIVINPALFPSLLQRRLVISDIEVQSPNIKANWDAIDNLRGLVRRDRGDKAGLSVAIGKIIIRDSVFQITPELELGSKQFTVAVNKEGENDNTKIDLFGNMEVSGRRLDVSGSVSTGENSTNGLIEIHTGDLSPSKIKMLNKKGSSLDSIARVNFEFSDVVKVYGLISVTPEERPKEEQESVLNIDYGINYNPSTNTASLEKLGINVNGFVQGSFKGGAVINDGDITLDINGSAGVRDLGVLKAFIPALDGDELSGSAEAQDLKLTGSWKKRDIKLTGGLRVNGASFEKTDDNLLISNLLCDLDINQDLGLSGSFPMESTGNCAADNFEWPKTGEIKDIKTKISISSEENWSDTSIELSDINASYMEGGIAGRLGFELMGTLDISGDLTGRDLNLNQAPKQVIPFDIEGRGESVEANFKGASGVYDAEISFAANDILVGLGKGRVFKLSQVRSLEDLRITYTSVEESEGAESTTRDQITIKSSGLSYKNLNFEDYLINSGRVKEILFSLVLGNDWSLALASQGSGFEVLGKGITLSSFNERLAIKNSGRDGFSGSVRGQDGKFKSIDFPSLSWDYSYRNGFIKLSALTADIGAIGRFETDDLTLSLGREGSYPIVSTFKNSKFTGLDENVSTKTLSGDFTINDPDSGGVEWDGNLEATSLDIVSQSLQDVHIDVTPTEKGLALKNISGTFLGGALSGEVDVDTTGPRANVISELDVTGAKIKSENMEMNISKTEFGFAGLLPLNSLPEGSGELKFEGLRITRNGESYSYRAGIRAKTEGETLLIEKGFILDKDSRELSFTGKMIDSLNEDRQLRLNMPGIQIPVLMNIVKPFVPASLAQAKTGGQADLELIFYNFFYPEQTWGGKLGVLRGEFKGVLSGTELSLKDIYGTVTIKDDADSPNPLSSFMPGQLKLSKSIYKKFLKSISEFETQDGSDFLKIGSVEYGIIKIENIDCLLEVDREEINLKRLSSKSYRGGLYAAGIYSFQDPGNYNISFLFDEISLEAISKSISSEKDYITGRVNGLAWITGGASGLDTINGPFMFWATNSPKEQRRIGEALLHKLGARERLILGSSRGYDRGEISGYINDGVITFRVFNISNSILGFQNLSIQADSRQNSISISHLISVIRELARRALTGGPTIETN